MATTSPLAAATPPRPPRTGASLGVEEEFFVVDAESGRTAPRAAEVLARAGHREDTGGGAAQFKQELTAGQVEAASSVCTGLEELAGELTANRRRLAEAADSLGLRLVSTGTPGVRALPCALSDGPRYEQIAGLFAEVARDYEVSGCHVHVAVPGREEAVAVLNHLRPWLPSLLALSANSPFQQGKDTGYDSWRAVQQSRFPGAGVPPYFPSAAAYDRAVERLVDCGAVVDDRMSFWLARPSPRFPTVELRAADAALTVPDALLQAALSRALVRTALDALAAGREAPAVDDQVCAAAVWSAARHGMHGPGVCTTDMRKRPATALVAELLERVSPALEESGDLARVRSWLEGVRMRGTGAARQRAAAAGTRPAPGGFVGFLAQQALVPGKADTRRPA